MGSSSKSEEETQFQFHEGTQVIDEELASAVAMDIKGSAQKVYKRKRGSQP